MIMFASFSLSILVRSTCRLHLPTPSITPKSPLNVSDAKLFVPEFSLEKFKAPETIDGVAPSPAFFMQKAVHGLSNCAPAFLDQSLAISSVA